MAKYDLPSQLNKALDTTGQSQLFYIGHSMGTTTVMAMADIHPEMKEKIILANLLAPVAYVEHMKSPIALIAPFANLLEVKKVLVFNPEIQESIILLHITIK